MISLLGVGGSGTVYRGELGTPEGPRPVAVKVPHRGCDLRREAAAIRRFVHPNVVTLIEPPATSSEPLLLELCNQGTLEDRLGEHPMFLREVRELVEAIGRALTALHAAGWIHGDVTPSNIGFRAHKEPCLFDFGCARPADGTVATNGTREYCGESLGLVPERDIRSLAATAQAALSADNAAVSRELDRFIARADDGELVSMAQLISVLEEFANSEQLPSLFPEQDQQHSCDQDRQDAYNAPQTPRTREFGPRPEPHEPAPASITVDDPDTRNRWAFALLALTCAVYLALVSPRMDSSGSPPLQPAELFEQFTPSETLENAQATWAPNGVISLELNGEFRTFSAGKAGDIAAIGDWNCDSELTLGIFRPSTGAWFTFESWSAEATSLVESLPSASSGGDLNVLVDHRGCATPTITGN